MPLSEEDIMLLRSQLEGLESVFLELIPFGVELKRQQIQDYYNKRFLNAVNPAPHVAEQELRRQFNTKANNVRNLIDNAESLGSASDRFNLIRAAAALPAQRSCVPGNDVTSFCRAILTRHAVDNVALENLLHDDIHAVEARILMGCLMFLIAEELECDGKLVNMQDVLAKVFDKGASVLEATDPFVCEARCVLEAMQESVS